jgi:hypothetical protein
MNCLPFCGNHRRQLFKKRVEIFDKLKRLRCSFLWPNNSLVKFPYLISAAIIEGSTCVRVPPMERRHGCVLSANPRLLSFPSSRARRSIAQSQLGLRLKNSGFKRLRRSTRDVATFCKRLAWIPHSRRRSYPMTRLLPLPFQPRPRIRRSFQVRLRVVHRYCMIRICGMALNRAIFHQVEDGARCSVQRQAAGQLIVAECSRSNRSEGGSTDRYLADRRTIISNRISWAKRGNRQALRSLFLRRLSLQASRGSTHEWRPSGLF